MIGRPRRGAGDRELAKHERTAELRAVASRRCPGRAAAEAEVVIVERPAQCVRELCLIAVNVCVATLAKGERSGPGPRELGRRLVRLELRDWITGQVRESRFVQHARGEDRGLVRLGRPRVTRERAPRARQRVAGDDVLRIRVVETIHIGADDDRVGRAQLVIQPAVEERLPIASDLRGAGQHKRCRNGRRSILVRVVERGEVLRAILHNRTADRGRYLRERIGNVGRHDRRGTAVAAGRDARRDRFRAHRVGAERLGLQPAGTAEKQSLTVHHIGSRFGNDVDGRARGPAELG